MRTRAGVLTSEQEALLVRAIGEAEVGNRGEGHVERRCPSPDAMARAREIFFELEMDRTSEDTAVLLYVAIASRECAVYAGDGIHGARGEGFWQGVADGLARGFAKNDPIGGFERALLAIGALLREVVPSDDAAGDELRDAVTVS